MLYICESRNVLETRYFESHNLFSTSPTQNKYSCTCIYFTFRVNNLSPTQRLYNITVALPNLPTNDQSASALTTYLIQRSLLCLTFHHHICILQHHAVQLLCRTLRQEKYWFTFPTNSISIAYNMPNFSTTIFDH